MLKSKMSWVMMAAAALGLGGGPLIMACGDDKPSAPASGPVKAPDAAVKTEATPAVAAPVAPKVEAFVPIKGASISGQVKIKGDVKKRKKIKMDADPKCAAMHAEPPASARTATADTIHDTFNFRM